MTYKTSRRIVVVIFRIWFLLLGLAPSITYAHPGGLDAAGGHYDQSTNEYHYHHSKTQPHSSSTSYNRSDWVHWIDSDGDCQDTRAEILIRDSIGPIKFKRNKPCNVSWGRWICPYTGKEFTKASDMDIDHIVPLSHANQTGGANWSRDKKREFANDPLNLIAVSGDVNKAKGDKGPAEWKPPRKACWGDYAERWKAVKVKYGLSIDKAEERALKVIE